MTTFLIAVGAMVPMLLILVVIHEWGHFATARALGVKVLEFGIGFPPRAFAVYTGRTRVLLDPHTQFVGIEGPGALTRGQFVKVSSSEDVHGNLVARSIEAPQPKGWFKGKVSQGGSQEIVEFAGAESEDYLKHEGKIRDLDGGSIILADLLYSVNWAPLGGFVRLAGESNPKVPRSLASKGVGTRFTVLVAGSFMNAILPIVIFTVMAMMPHDVRVGQVQITKVEQGSAAEAARIHPGDILLQARGKSIESETDLINAVNLNGSAPMDILVQRGDGQESLRVQPRFESPDGNWRVGIRIAPEVPGRVSVTEVASGSPAEAAGLQKGDVVIRADGQAVSSTDDLIGITNASNGSLMQWVVSRSGREVAIDVSARFEESRGPQFLIGVSTNLINDRVERRSEPVWAAVPQSFVRIWDILVMTKQGLSAAISKGDSSPVAGPVGIAKVAGEFTREGGFTGWLVITVLLSINLAILNILPIPMLDGGRVVFVLLEWVRRGRRIPAEKEGLVHLIGFVVLMAGVLLITANDIRNLLPG